MNQELQIDVQEIVLSINKGIGFEFQHNKNVGVFIYWIEVRLLLYMVFLISSNRWMHPCLHHILLYSHGHQYLKFIKFNKKTDYLGHIYNYMWTEGIEAKHEI